MIEIKENERSILLKTSSSREQVGEVISAFASFLEHRQLEQHSINKAIIVLRELLINAIVHGNKLNKIYPVIIGIDQLQDNRLKISVKDLGQGFNTRMLETALPENPRQMHARGYRLVNAVSESFEFNQTGNEVTAYISTLRE